MQRDSLTSLRGYLETVKLELQGVEWYLKQVTAPEGANVNHHHALMGAMHQLLRGILGVFGRDADTMSEMEALEECLSKLREGKKRDGRFAQIAIPDYEDGAHWIRLGGMSFRGQKPALSRGDVKETFDYVVKLQRAGVIVYTIVAEQQSPKH